MTANPERGEVELKVGEKSYICVLKTRGYITLQKRYGLESFDELHEKVFQPAMRGSFEHLAAVFWASFQKYHPDITFDQAVDIMDEVGDLADLNAAMFGIAESAVADPKDVEELRSVTSRPRKARARGTGGNSGSTPAAAA